MYTACKNITYKSITLWYSLVDFFFDGINSFVDVKLSSRICDEEQGLFSTTGPRFNFKRTTYKMAS